MAEFPDREADPTIYEPPKMALDDFKSHVAPEDLRMWCVTKAIAFLSVPGTAGNIIVLAGSIEKFVKDGDPDG